MDIREDEAVAAPGNTDDIVPFAAEAEPLRGLFLDIKCRQPGVLAREIQYELSL